MSVYIENKNHNPLAKSLPFIDAKSIYSGFLLLIKQMVKQSIKKIAFWIERSHQRKELANLSERMLDDIGYSAEEVQKEISKPFWK